MLNIIFGEPLVVQAPNTDRDFSIEIIETPSSTMGWTTEWEVNDGRWLEMRDGVTDNNFILVIDNPLNEPAVEVENETPDIISYNHVTGQASWLKNGMASLLMKGKYSTRRYIRQMYRATSGAVTYTFIGYRPGTLGNHLVNTINSMISGKNPGADRQRFATFNNLNTDNPTVTRNANLFITRRVAAIGVMNGTPGNVGEIRPPILISPRHLLVADHYRSSGTVVFEDYAGNYFKANVLRYSRITGDLAIAYLDAAIPDTIQPFKVLPDDSYRWMPPNPTINGVSLQRPMVPVMFKGMHNQLGGWLSQMTIAQGGERWTYTNGNLVATSINHIAPNSYFSYLAPWYATITGGDSASPLFVFINDEPVLLCAFHTATTSPNVRHYASAINAAMNAIKDPSDTTVYALERVDLSDFLTFN